MGKIVEIDGVIVGNNGDITLNESKFEDLLIESGFNIYGDDEIIDSTLVFDCAFDLGFTVISLYADSDNYHLVMKNSDISKLEETNKEMYNAIDKLIDNYSEKIEKKLKSHNRVYIVQSTTQNLAFEYEDGAKRAYLVNCEGTGFIVHDEESIIATIKSYYDDSKEFDFDERENLISTFKDYFKDFPDKYFTWDNYWDTKLNCSIDPIWIKIKYENVEYFSTREYAEAYLKENKFRLPNARIITICLD